MALSNFSLPFGSLSAAVQPWGVTLSPPTHPHQLAANTNNLLYAPSDHQQQQDDEMAPPIGSDYYKNNPYAHPQLHQVQQNQQQQPKRKQVIQFGALIHNNNNNNNNNVRRKGGNTYLPPIPPPGARNTQHYEHQQQQHNFNQQQDHTYKSNELYKTSSGSTSSAATATASSLSSTTATQTRTYTEGTYKNYPINPLASKNSDVPTALHQEQSQSQPQQHQQQYHQYYNSASGQNGDATFTNTYSNTQQHRRPAPTYGVSATATGAIDDKNKNKNNNYMNANSNYNNDEIEDTENGSYPDRPPGFTSVQAGQGSRTQVHAVLDYDVEDEEVDDYYDAEDHGEQVNVDGRKSSSMPTVTPIQGPIFLKNGTVPVVPLFSYPSISNGSFVQIPIWWTALSVALGLDVRGDVIKGVPCIKRFHQLFCPTAGNSYPIDKIEQFIDDNKALMRRMYGDFEMNLDNGGPRQQTKKRKRRFIDEHGLFDPPGAVIHDDEQFVNPHAEEAGDSYFGKLRTKRQGAENQNRNRKDQNNNKAAKDPSGSGPSSTGRLDACESKVEIVTPYWASNSAGKIRAIVNTQHFEQAIHQEICSKTQTQRCEGDCGCEQKYKWHRLLAYDPDNDCKGIFMDWFLFPSCCVCRCNP